MGFILGGARPNVKSRPIQDYLETEKITTSIDYPSLLVLEVASKVLGEHFRDIFGSGCANLEGEPFL